MSRAAQESVPAIAVEQLQGTWDLVSFTRIINGDPIGDVLGPDPVGRLSYQRDGRVSALLMRRDRQWPPDTEFLTADDRQRGAAALGFVGYGGRFELRGDQVVHRVDISLYPEHVGTELVRTVRWMGERLVLSTEPRRTRSGRTMCDRLEWRPLSQTA